MQIFELKLCKLTYKYYIMLRRQTL